MAWGIDEKLKEHTTMIDSRVDSKIQAVEDHIKKVDSDFQLYKLDCSEKHRRQSDEIKVIILSQQRSEVSQTNTDKNVQCIKNILETYLPNLKDAEEKRATKHQLKEGALLISAIFGALLTVSAVILAIMGYFNGFFVR